MNSFSPEYLQILYDKQVSRQNSRPPVVESIYPEKKIYKVDLNTREIELPKELSVQHDHKAETVYFQVDRYYDNKDLSQSMCVIEFVNAAGENGLFFVPYYDAETKKDTNQLLFFWEPDKYITRAAGTIRVSMKFYLIDKTYHQNGEFVFSLNTKTATTIIVGGSPIKEEDDILEVEPEPWSSNIITNLHEEIVELRKSNAVYWEEAKNLGF